MGLHMRFVQIAADDSKLYALDADGRVWKYVPAETLAGRYAFWTRLTDYCPELRKEPNDDA